MRDECVAECTLRPFEPGELESIEPQSTTVLADVGADAADLQVG
jgi:hypothetical protein